MKLRHLSVILVAALGIGCGQDRALPSSGTLDYTGATGGAAKTSNGHSGIDIDAPNFRWMDDGVPAVLAAASGVVTGRSTTRFEAFRSNPLSWVQLPTPGVWTVSFFVNGELVRSQKVIAT